MGSSEMLVGVLNHVHIRQLKADRRPLSVGLAGLAFVLVWAILSSSALAQETEYGEYDGTINGDDETKWPISTTRRAEWETRRVQDEDEINWAGGQRLRKERTAGSVWWDEEAEQYFISKLEESQFPADCSKSHWIVKHEMHSGLLSVMHVFQHPLFFAMMRGLPLIPVSNPLPEWRHAFQGCGTRVADLTIQCYLNVTHCDPEEDPTRWSHISTFNSEDNTTKWDDLIMEPDDFFSPGGLTMIDKLKQGFHTDVCATYSSFSSYREAYQYNMFSVWHAMGRHGKVGTISLPHKGCSSRQLSRRKHASSLQVEMGIVSLLSSWMLKQVSNSVKLVADQIMSRYMDSSGQPLWKSPVLVIHIRQTDKGVEDPYWVKHGEYRPTEDYAEHMWKIEEEYGFEWPTIFIISDSGIAMESFITLVNGIDPTTSEQNKKRFIMKDWILNDHLIEDFSGHTGVPTQLKKDMQTHFLASLYIVQKIADHAIVTYSSNVGRFISEILAARERLASVYTHGPLVSSLDTLWNWE